MRDVRRTPVPRPGVWRSATRHGHARDEGDNRGGMGADCGVYPVMYGPWHVGGCPIRSVASMIGGGLVGYGVGSLIRQAGSLGESAMLFYILAGLAAGVLAWAYVMASEYAVPDGAGIYTVDMLPVGAMLAGVVLGYCTARRGADRLYVHGDVFGVRCLMCVWCVVVYGWPIPGGRGGGVRACGLGVRGGPLGAARHTHDAVGVWKVAY